MDDMAAAAAKVRVLVCLDVSSPYSWFALTVLLRYKERWNLRLELLPVLLGAVHAATGNTMPSRVPARGRWLAEDIKRNTSFMGVPFRGIPAAFGTTAFNSMLCQRFLTAIAESKGYDTEELAAAFMALFKAIWGVKPDNEVDITDPSFVLKSCIAAGINASDAREYLHSTKDAAIKLRLKDNTALAVEKGAFGVPTMFVASTGTSERESSEMMLFGSDRFEQLAFAVGKRWEGPNPLTSRL